ncbi:acetyl-CoA hydrolase/transferase family protein [Rhodohalobacter sp.]|uniref:acetyl-CoA hydrolase/transferase family protein n=1 Tax=Rhodohalobacter sp. TaxID=1974210 RepID=UPI002ACE29D7|nr:acetyl-CoA hydrolase/transferase C-terminal domain-containing protein [Rhodohalobacter sp.]MDZ7757471.1 acetyl-CoA hydrolase/transferase C-terminal domain-containing protein [Rhodohalobacter sp.]
MKITSSEEAVKGIKSEDKVYIHTAAAAPQQLIKAMTSRHEELRDVYVYHLHTEGAAPYVKPEYRDSFNTRAFFVGSNVRNAIKEGYADYIPIFLSEIPHLFNRGIIKLDVAVIQVSPPDKHGFCSLGVSVDASRAAVNNAKMVIAQINPNMPRTHGDGIIHQSEIDFATEVNDPLPEHAPAELSEVELDIGRYCAELVDDGAALQMGIGSIPDAVLASLKNHKNLGVHTEMFSDGLISLVESGVINNSNKKIHPNRLVSSFAVGTRKLYDFMDDNPNLAMLDCAYVNDTAVIRRNPKVTAVNSAIEVDLTGQICADSIGTYLYSGVGGQMDFIRGASLSEGGKPIIALPSSTKHGVNRIVPFLKQGAGVVTTRAHVHYVVTEYGIASLYGKGLKERASELIKISHPDHREMLNRAAYDRFKSL